MATMSSNFEIYKVEGELKVNGSAYDLVSVECVSRINAWPVVTAVYYIPSSNMVEDAMSDRLISELSDNQSRMFTDREEPDVEIGITLKTEHNASNENVNFTGYLTSMGAHVTQQSTSISITALPEYAKMDAMSFSIYKEVVNIDSNNPLKFTTLSKFIEDIIDNMIAAGVDDTGADDLEKEDLKRQEEINNKQMETFKTLIRASEQALNTTLPAEALALDGKNGHYVANLKQAIVNTLKARRGSFLTNIVALAELFNCFYVPGTTGKKDDPGRFVSKSVVTFEDDVECNFTFDNSPILNLNVNIGSTSLFPVTSVYVKTNQDTQNIDHSKSSHYYAFPNNTTEGTRLAIDVPAWLPSKAIVIMSASSSKKPKISSDENEVNEQKKQTKKQLDEFTKKLSELVKTWCETSFYWMALNNNAINVTLPAECIVQHVGGTETNGLSIAGYTAGLGLTDSENPSCKFLITMCRAVLACDAKNSNSANHITIAGSHALMSGFSLTQS